VQAEVERRRHRAGERVFGDQARWFLDEVHRLYGFAVDGIDYDRPLELDLPWPLAR
jgi:enoyl-[acyl-carrier protein] reductase/trans-2-enoyl-CoA reductase (NAD+)